MGVKLRKEVDPNSTAGDEKVVVVDDPLYYSNLAQSHTTLGPPSSKRDVPIIGHPPGTTTKKMAVVKDLTLRLSYVDLPGIDDVDVDDSEMLLFNVFLRYEVLTQARSVRLVHIEPFEALDCPDTGTQLSLTMHNSFKQLVNCFRFPEEDLARSTLFF
jgi:hypothetical protein